MRERRAFADEFKKKAVGLVFSGIPVSKVASDLDLTPSALTRWVRQTRRSKSEAPHFYCCAKDPSEARAGTLSKLNSHALTFS